MVELVTIQRATQPTDEIRALVAELQATLAEHYAPEQQHGVPIEGLFAPSVRFFVARQGGVAIGCCGVAFDSDEVAEVDEARGDAAELKRMFVRPAGRGRGIARALLAHVEAEVRAHGATTIRLETGDRQHDAIRLYERAGYRRCASFGTYAAMPPQAIATSVFMEKELDDAT